MTGFNAIGFKLMYDQAKQFPMIMDYITQNNIKIIHVVRNNVLKTLLSLLSAKQRSLYHSHQTIAVNKIHLPTRLLNYRLRKIDSQNRYWETFLNTDSSCYCKIEYEQLLENMTFVKNKLLSFLNTTNNVDLTSPLKKINPNKIEDIILNYSEAKAYLKNTRFYWCLQQ